MLEPAVTITDFIVAAECAVVAALTLRAPSSPVRNAFLMMFAGIGTGAFAGALVHGFFADPASEIHVNLWLLTLASLGVMALAGWCVGAVLLLQGKWVGIVQRVALLELLGYCFYISQYESGFAVALANYLPAVLFMMTGFICLWRKTQARAVLAGIAGLLLTFIGAGVQHFKLALHPVYFDHNALFHLIQFTAIILIYICARHLTGAKHETP